MKIQHVNNNYNKSSNPSFQKKGDVLDRLSEKVSKEFGEKYGQKMYDSKTLRKVSKAMSKLPGEATTHLATVGSVITSSVYMWRTLHNKELDADKRRTLTANQFGCMVIPAIGTYSANSFLGDFKKTIEYEYAGRQNQKLASGLLSDAEAEVLKSKMGKRLKGVQILAELAIFTLIYRYITPVLITPFANKIGEKINARHKAAKETENAENSIIKFDNKNNEQKTFVKSA